MTSIQLRPTQNRHTDKHHWKYRKALIKMDAPGAELANTRNAALQTDGDHPQGDGRQVEDSQQPEEGRFQQVIQRTPGSHVLVESCQEPCRKVPIVSPCTSAHGEDYESVSVMVQSGASKTVAP